MRTLCRALAAARSLIIQQRHSPQRAILEGFELAFEGSLDLPSRLIVQKLFNSLLNKGLSAKERDHPGRRPGGKHGVDTHVLIKPFWLKSGNEEQTDWSEPISSSNGRPRFVLTPSATANLRRLCQAVASGPWSVLLCAGVVGRDPMGDEPRGNGTGGDGVERPHLLGDDVDEALKFLAGRDGHGLLLSMRMGVTNGARNR